MQFIQSKKTKHSISSRNILLVEDVESILLSIKDFLTPEFSVKSFSNGEQALIFFEDNPDEIDLIISDINLPGMTGIELIEKARSIKPGVKTALITSYEINSYIQYIEELEIDQVISKHSDLALVSIKVMAEKMLTGDVFGVDRYFPGIKETPGKGKQIDSIQEGDLVSFIIQNDLQRLQVIDFIADTLKCARNISETFTKLILDEITTNAMVRAPLDQSGDHKYQRKIPDKDLLIPAENIELDPEDFFKLQFGFWEDWVFWTTVDPHGSLDKKEVLYRLKRHLTIDPGSGLPEGLNDSHGRGIFLMREQLTHLVFNIKKGSKTEVIALFNQKHKIPYKNISIYELD